MALLLVDAGDVIAIPAAKAGKLGFVLARVIIPIRTRTIEVFREFRTDFAISEEEVRAQDFSVASRLFNPVYASLDFGKPFGVVKWPILLKNPHYDKEMSNFSDIEFEDATEYEEFGRYYKGGEECYEPQGVRRDLESRTIYSNPQLVHRIKLHLAGYLNVGEPLNSDRTRKAIQENGEEWWITGISACRDLSDEVTKRLIEAQRRRKSAQTR
jgi:hypothetical protein